MVKFALRRFFYGFANSNFFYGKHAQRIMNECLPNARSAVIYNSLDVDLIRDHAERASKLTVGYEWDLIYVGRLTSIKRLDILIDAVAIQQQQGRSLKVLIVGEGEIKSELMSRASSKSISSCFEWVGACYEEELLSSYFSKSRFCVSPGNIGLMAMHALNNDTPIITHGDLTNQMPEAEAVHDGKNGFLFTRGSAADLSVAIDRAMGSDYDALRSRCFMSVRERYTPIAQAGVFWSELSMICNSK
jgi:glycosyltransferase involved in cell wall biosynthesis